MPRYKILIEYDGTPFAGWQSRPTRSTVQGAIEAAIEASDRRTGGDPGRGPHRCRRACARAGRAFRSRPSDRETDTVRDALNAHLRPHPIAVLAAENVPDDFDARLSATQAALSLSHRQPARGSGARPSARLARAAPARRRARCTTRRSASSASTISRRSARPNARPSRRCSTLDRLDVTRDGDDVQHRRVGALVPAQSGALDGRLARAGRRRPNGARDDLAAALAARDRTACGPVAPAEGLYLVRVDY